MLTSPEIFHLTLLLKKKSRGVFISLYLANCDRESQKGQVRDLRQKVAPFRDLEPSDRTHQVFESIDGCPREDGSGMVLSSSEAFVGGIILHPRSAPFRQLHSKPQDAFFSFWCHGRSLVVIFEYPITLCYYNALHITIIANSQVP